MSTPTPTEQLNRRQQLMQTYRMAKKTDRLLSLWMLGAFIVGAAIGFALFSFLPGPIWLFPVLGGLLIGFLLMMIIFGRRAQNAAYRQMDGQRGAAAAALSMLRRGWKVDSAIAVTKQQDVVHRVIGPPGIVLVAEGNPNRIKGLLLTERRKHERVVADTPIHEVVCGNGEGEVPLPKLVKHVTKLGKGLKGPALTDVLFRLKALDANRSAVPLPKGPVPTSMKGQRGNLRGR
ncbi:DUF4191 domain-containing protein [Nocardioides sp. Bht2]|uniref:DUF4191 domain-containing protein n=1 Tax=Nocardioides sp. Bht2 TaxID=3392297 RepID=UPI0039B51D33